MYRAIYLSIYLSYLILSYLILSYLILSYLILSYLSIYLSIFSTLPSQPKSLENAMFHISRACIFFLLTLSLSLFYSSLLSDSSHLCFSSLHIVGSLTFELPLMILFFRFIWLDHLNKQVQIVFSNNGWVTKFKGRAPLYRLETLLPSFSSQVAS